MQYMELYMFVRTLMIQAINCSLRYGHHIADLLLLLLLS